MIEFRTLGTFDLDGLDRDRRRAILSQPKRLGLMAYLCLATPRGFHARDLLVAIFWPESDTNRARTSLRKALHFLDHHLGHDVVKRRGDTVGLDSSLLWCDALAFEEAADAGSSERASSLYAGELLRGLHVSSAPEFERWLDDERARLRTKASEAAWELALRQENEGNWARAAEHARRAATLSPELEGAVRRVIRLLDRAGERAAAVREYETFTRQLADEYALEPSPETTDLIEAVRARAAAADGTGQPRLPTGAPSVAVLPFSSIGTADETEHLAEGTTEDIITHLSKLPGLKVISRTSVMRFKGRKGMSVAEIRDELGVDAFVEGSVRLVGGEVRVVAQLIDTRRDEHLWAETYDRQLSHVFSIQSDIALQIAQALQMELSAGVTTRIETRPTENMEAYSLYLQGRYGWNKRTWEAVKRAIDCYERAIAADPGFALAHVGLAECHIGRAWGATISFKQALVDARASSLRALELDDTTGAAHTMLGMVKALLDWDWPSAKAECLRALELSPNHATGHHWYGVCLAVWGPREESLPELQRALELDPLSPTIRVDIALVHFSLGRADEALDELRTIAVMDPQYWRAHYNLATIYTGLGRQEQAVDHLLDAWRVGAFGTGAEEYAALSRASSSGWRAVLECKLEWLRERREREHVTGFELAVVCALLEMRDEVVRWLEEAWEDRSAAMVLQALRAFDAFRGDARFNRLLKRSGVAGI